MFSIDIEKIEPIEQGFLRIATDLFNRYFLKVKDNFYRFHPASTLSNDFGLMETEKGKIQLPEVVGKEIIQTRRINLTWKTEDKDERFLSAPYRYLIYLNYRMAIKPL